MLLAFGLAWTPLHATRPPPGNVALAARCVPFDRPNAWQSACALGAPVYVVVCPLVCLFGTQAGAPFRAPPSTARRPASRTTRRADVQSRNRCSLWRSRPAHRQQAFGTVDCEIVPRCWNMLSLWAETVWKGALLSSTART